MHSTSYFGYESGNESGSKKKDLRSDPPWFRYITDPFASLDATNNKYMGRLWPLSITSIGCTILLELYFVGTGTLRQTM